MGMIDVWQVKLRMYSPRKYFSLCLREGKLKYCCILLVIILNISGLLRGNYELFAQTQTTSAVSSELLPIQSVEQNIPIGDNVSNPSPDRGGVSFFTILRMILVLTLAAAAVYGIVFFLKRISKIPEQRDSYLKVLAGVHLGYNRFIHVVSVGDRAWVVGASEGGVSLISEIVDKETIDAILLDISRKKSEMGTTKFIDLFKRFRSKESAETYLELNAKNVRDRRERLRELDNIPSDTTLSETDETLPNANPSIKIKGTFLALWLFLCFFFVSPTIRSQSLPFPDMSTPGTMSIPASQSPQVIPFIDLTVRNPESGQEVAFSFQLLLLITILSLAPSIFILMTSFLRISIVLDFVKRALSLQQVPPNQVLMGISLFLTIFVMWPTFQTVYDNSFKPLAEGTISVQQAYREAESPLRFFMYNQMRSNPDNIRLFMAMRGLDRPETLADVPTYVLIPAFILSELTIAFKIGILLFIPFIVIDMVVASALMSMGMIMLPPVMISMPFKLILFILVDGWGLLTDQLVRSFS
jgi:flagellar biosynthetic protein FliP